MAMLYMFDGEITHTDIRVSSHEGAVYLFEYIDEDKNPTKEIMMTTLRARRLANAILEACERAEIEGLSE